jgi:hypothetical protein
MDIFTPKMMIGGAIVATLSATVNTGMFTYVNDTVQENKVQTAVHTEQISEIKDDQGEIKEQTQEIYDWVLKQQGKLEP